jgi:hypothetical protein
MRGNTNASALSCFCLAGRSHNTYTLTDSDPSPTAITWCDVGKIKRPFPPTVRAHPVAHPAPLDTTLGARAPARPPSRLPAACRPRDHARHRRPPGVQLPHVVSGLGMLVILTAWSFRDHARLWYGRWSPPPLLPSLSSEAQHGDWTMWRGNAPRAGVQAQPGVAPGGRMRWQRQGEKVAVSFLSSIGRDT